MHITMPANIQRGHLGAEEHGDKPRAQKLAQALDEHEHAHADRHQLGATEDVDVGRQAHNRSAETDKTHDDGADPHQRTGLGEKNQRARPHDDHGEQVERLAAAHLVGKRARTAARR